MGKVLTGTRLVLLGLTAVFNWLMILTMAVFVTNGHIVWALLISFVFAGGLVLLGLSPWGEDYFRSTHGLRLPSRWERGKVEPALQTVLYCAGKLAIKPELFISPDRFPNALAIGSRTIAVTEGLLRRDVTDEEMEGILAHEIAHLVHGDTRILLVASIMNSVGGVAVWVITALAGLLAVGMEFFGNTEGYGWLLGIALAVWAWSLRLLAWIFYRLLEISFLAVGRQAEHAADSYSAGLGFGSGLITFLARDLSEYRRTPSPSLMCRFYATHPPAEKRIERIRQVMGARTAD